MTQEERLEWLEKRRTGLGGTDIAKIIVDAAPHAKRVGCYRGSIFQMWAEKVGLHQPSEYTMSDAARRGIQLESYVCGLYKDYLNEEVEFTEFGSIKHPTRSIVRGSPDRMVKALDSGVTWGMDAMCLSIPKSKCAYTWRYSINHSGTWRLCLESMTFGSTGWTVMRNWEPKFSTLLKHGGKLTLLETCHPTQMAMRKPGNFWHISTTSPLMNCDNQPCSISNCTKT